MTELFVKIPESGYHFNERGIKTLEEKYGAKYMGYWCTTRTSGGWNETPVDVFYQPNPDTSKGHTHYFGMFRQGERVWITEASSAFSEPITGIICEDGEVLVSRCRHDYVTKGEHMIDGGRDYTRCSISPSATVKVVDDQFLIERNYNAILSRT
jgi:hypothetical protein